MEGITLMAKKKEPTPGEAIAKSIIQAYDPKTTEDIQDALKSIFGPIFESMLEGELNYHLGYESNDHTPKDTINRRNGHGKKTLKMILSIMLDTLYSHILLLPMQPKLMRHSTSAS